MATPKQLTTMVAAVKDAAAALAECGESMKMMARTEQVYRQALLDVSAWEEAQEFYMAARNIDSPATLGRRPTASPAHRDLVLALKQKRDTEEAAAAALAKAETSLKNMTNSLASSP